jgi:8-oxo-dGTP pyrophosphatase MutT (NUDIX family)
MQAAAPILAHDLPADWRERLRRGLRGEPDHRLEHCRIGGVAGLAPGARAQMLGSLGAALQPAAVLLPIIDDPLAPALLLTVRASHLRRHAGQISFPGGRLEAHDADIAAAAMRETEEEIGIRSECIEPIGFLTDHVVQTGYRITPVVALLQPGFVLKTDRSEVAEVFELPLGFALARANYRQQRRRMREIDVDSWELDFGDHRIWGATAGILVNLVQVVAGGEA